MSQATIPNSVKAEAAAWIARLHADARTPEDDRAFQIWITEHPSHALAFEAVTAVWDAAGSFSSTTLSRLREREGPGKAPKERSREGAGSLLTRRKILASLGSVAFGVTAFTAYRSAYAGVYETDIGEQKHVALADGTQVFLDTDTRIRARFDSNVRTVALEKGRANFRVSADAVRPFIVNAAEQRIVAASEVPNKNTPQNTLDIRRDGDTVSVVLIQGQATIMSTTAGSPRQSGIAATAGQRAIITAAAAPQMDRPNLNSLLAWQSGQAVFENETLADAVKEMNRYSTVKLAIADPSLGALRMSGVYRIGDNTAFARSVAALLRIDVRTSASELQLIAAR